LFCCPIFLINEVCKVNFYFQKTGEFMPIYNCYQTVFLRSCSEILKIDLRLLLIMDKFGIFGINKMELLILKQKQIAIFTCGQKE